MSHNSTQTSINIPQLLAVAVVGFLAIRWWMSKPTTGASSSSGSSSSSARRNLVDPSKILQVSAMFPQLDHRSIAWDLQRNGGSVEATTERILGGRGLENPPPSFQPVNLPTIPAAPAQSTTSTAAQSGAKKTNPDLITRYNLQSRVNGKGKEPVVEGTATATGKSNAWSADKGARAEALRKRREEMILAARRKMEERETQQA